MATLTEEDPSQSNRTPPEQHAAASEASAIAEDAANDLQKVERLMGRQHVALYAFIGVFLAVLASAIAYMAGRQGPAVSTVAASRPVTVIARASAPAEPAKVVVAAPPPKVVIAPAAAPEVKPIAIAGPAVLEEVLPNRMYLQVGSLDKNVAELLTQGLRIKGVPATIAPGVNATVSRIIVGPFQTAVEMGVVQKQLTELGFTPFPRQFQLNELHPAAAQSAAAAIPKP